jgi:uncharacterized protein
MATLDQASARRSMAQWSTPLLVVAALVLAALAVRVLNGAGVAAVQNFLLVFGSLLIEALPFIVLGAAVSALIEVFIPARAFARLARLPRGVQMPVAGLGGFAFPVCECGSVPVARRLIAKGMHPGAGLAFMLASPRYGTPLRPISSAARRASLRTRCGLNPSAPVVATR